MIIKYFNKIKEYNKNFGLAATITIIYISVIENTIKKIGFKSNHHNNPFYIKQYFHNPLSFKFEKKHFWKYSETLKKASLIILTENTYYDSLCLKSLLAWKPLQINEILIGGNNKNFNITKWSKKIIKNDKIKTEIICMNNLGRLLNSLIEKSTNDNIIILSGLSIPAPGTIDQMINNLELYKNKVSAIMPVTNSFGYTTQTYTNYNNMNEFLKNAEMLYRMKIKLITTVYFFDGLCLGISKNTWNITGKFDDTYDDLHFLINDFISKGKKLNYPALCVESALLHSYNFESYRNHGSASYFLMRSSILKSSLKQVIDLLNLTNDSVDVLYAIIYNNHNFKKFTSDLFSLNRFLSVQREKKIDNPFLLASNLPSEQTIKKRRKILFITSQFPNPHHGGGLRVFNFIKILSRDNDIYLATSYSILDNKFFAEFESYCCSIHRIEGEKWGNNQLDIIKWLDNNYMDVVHYEWPLSLQNYDPSYGRNHIFTYMESVSLRLVMDMEKLKPLSEPWIRNFIDLISFLWIELSDASLMDARIAVTLKDAEFFYRLFPYQNFLILNHGVNFSEFCLADTEPELNTIVFVGNFQHYPNFDAMKYFFNEIWDSVRKEINNVRIYVVGAFPPEELCGLNDGKSIIVTGQVEDIRPYIQRAAIGIAPLISGAGMRGKVIDYAALRRTFIATSIAATDLVFENGRDYICADTPADTAVNIIRLLNNHEKSKEMGQSAFNVAMNNYDNKIFVNYLNRLYDNLEKKNNV